MVGGWDEEANKAVVVLVDNAAVGDKGLETGMHVAQKLKALGCDMRGQMTDSASR